MTKQEFTKRTGLSVTDQQYVAVENTYMAIGDDIDKDKFCEIYMNKELLASIMTSRAIEYQRKMNKAQKEQRAFFDEMADFMIEQSHKWGATDLRDKAIEMLGAAEYLRRKIEKDYTLWEIDKELLINMLVNKK